MYVCAWVYCEYTMNEYNLVQNRYGDMFIIPFDSPLGRNVIVVINGVRDAFVIVECEYDDNGKPVIGGTAKLEIIYTFNSHKKRRVKINKLRADKNSRIKYYMPALLRYHAQCEFLRN